MPRLRTGYSFRAAAGQIEECISRIQECEWPVAPITDRASTFGWTKWQRAAQAAGLRPVFGVELAVTPDLEAKKPVFDYWTFIAGESIAPINRLVALATSQFRYQPLLTLAQAVGARDVQKIVGHRSPPEEIPVQAGLQFALSPTLAKGQLKRIFAAGHPLVASSDNLFPRVTDRPFYEVLAGRMAASQTYDQHIQTDSEWCASVRSLNLGERALSDALQARHDIWSSSIAPLRMAQIVQPLEQMTLKERCVAASERLGCDLSRPEYSERLERELALIDEKQFEDYFNIVGDLCRWARRHMAVGPARGSSCGSLVCYLLEITTVDPIPHGLIFERFIDTNRKDLPDIDIDFSDQKRERVFEYLREKYGEDRVARVGAVAMYKGRSALQEAAAALKIPRYKCDDAVRSLIERSGGDSRVNDTLEDTLNTTGSGRLLLKDHPEIIIGARLEGHPRHYTQHASGVVVARDPIVDCVAVDSRTGAIMADKYDAEGVLGLLKIDALGLTQLSIFEDCLEMIGLTMDDLQAAPIDDQAAFDVLNRGEFSGIFQWNGAALQSLTRHIKVDRFSDLAAISALARPGPLATGGAMAWSRRRMGKEAPSKQHPLLAAQTEETYGVVIYQETVMTICRSIGNFSWADTAAIRKLMSNSSGNEKFAKFQEQFLAGAQSNGMSLEASKEVWDQINTFGSWAFNKSHAVAYAYMSYWCCWLKAHHKHEFAAATLTHEDAPDRQVQILRELNSEGCDYVPVDAAISIDRWAVGLRGGKKFLVGPLQNVNGIDPAIVNQIMGARARGEPMPARAQKLLTNPKTTIDSLTPVADALRRLMPDPSVRNIRSRPTLIKDLPFSAEAYEALLFVLVTAITPRDENEDGLVVKRGHKLTDGTTEFLTLRIRDDTGAILGKVNRFNFKKVAPQIMSTGKAGKALWALKGKLYSIDDGLQVLSINQARYIGEMDD